MLAQSVSLDHADGGSVSRGGTPEADPAVSRSFELTPAAQLLRTRILGRGSICARLPGTEGHHGAAQRLRGLGTSYPVGPRSSQTSGDRRVSFSGLVGTTPTRALDDRRWDGWIAIPPAIVAEASEGLDLGDQPPTVGLRHGQDDAILVDLWTCELGRSGALVDEQQDLDVGQTGGAHHRDFADLGLYHGLVLDRERFHHLGCRLDELLLETTSQQSTDLPCVLVEALVVIAEHLLDDDARGRRRSRPVTGQGAAVVRGFPHDHGGDQDR